MGQKQSIPENIIPDTVDALQIEVLKHARVFSEIGLLKYEDFSKCLEALNELSRKCSDSNGKQLMFLVKKGTDSSVFWKATVRIACVKVDSETRQIESHKFLNLKQFLCVFKAFESHLHSLMSTEEQTMGSVSSHFEMDPYADDVILELMDVHQNDLISVLHSMVRRVPIDGKCTMKMPIIRKRPDLSKFRDTDLYNEIKYLSGYSSDDNLSENLSIEKMLMRRENGIGKRQCGSFSENDSRKISNMYIPNRKVERLMSLETKIFCSKFNKSGSRLITASQDHVIRIFDASQGTYLRTNRIVARDVSWCILDIDFSPDEQSFVYATWSDYLHVSRIDGTTEELQCLHLDPDHTRLCVFSVRFSPCGEYIMAGANDSCIYFYNRELGRRTTKVRNLNSEYEDVNAVSFIDSSSNLFVSGDDDGYIKLWDSRCLNGKYVSAFLGHFDGITYIDSRNDGRYFLSNSKDQSIKIWDLRNPTPTDKISNQRPIRCNWDYRWDNVPRDFYNPTKEIDGDTSIMTYRGHRVTKSLIRAKFSPMEQTGQRYIYTGCGTGRVIIYDVLTGQIKEAIEGHCHIVRDVDWHPVRSEIISSSWDYYVNLNKYARPNSQKRRNSGLSSSETQQPLRRSRRLALQKTRKSDDMES